jgi:2,5-diamino-6-(ribosylamino)-4(3H)-pyrimidinone 5'-phosphate reductase
LFRKLKQDYKIDNLTIQTGGTLNSILLRNRLIDKISIVMAPVLIGGNETATLIDGKSLSSFEELTNIKALKLTAVNKLENSYLQLNYDVINDTIIE